MHIALFTPGWPIETYQNGIVTYVHWMKPELERLGHRVTLVTGATDALAGVAGVCQVRRTVWQRAVRKLARSLRIKREFFETGHVIGAAIRKAHRRDPIDLIEMEESFGWSADVARVSKLPVLVKLHGPAFLSLIDEELTTAESQRRIEQEGWSLKQAHAIASPCQVTLDQTLERYALNPEIRAQVANPLALEEANPQWQLGACDASTILFVGRFDKRKGADVVLQAFKILLKGRPNLKLIFVGPDNGLTQSDGSRLGFEAFCNSLFDDDERTRIEYRGRMANRDIVDLRIRAMVTVVASRWENPGYTALEAMYQACPVVCSDAGGCAEIIDDGRTGLLARSEHPADFAMKIAVMLDNPQAAQAMGRAAREYVIRTHSASKVAADSLALYEQLIAHHRAAKVW